MAFFFQSKETVQHGHHQLGRAELRGAVAGREAAAPELRGAERQKHFVQTGTASAGRKNDVLGEFFFWGGVFFVGDVFFSAIFLMFKILLCKFGFIDVFWLFFGWFVIFCLLCFEWLLVLFFLLVRTLVVGLLVFVLGFLSACVLFWICFWGGVFWVCNV